MSYITPELLQKFTNSYSDDESHLLGSLYCGAACDVVNNYLGYSPEEKHYTKVFNGDSSNCINLGVKKIVEIENVLICGVEYNLKKFISDEEYLYFITEVFPEGKGNIVVKFLGGWKEVPSIIKMTAARIAGVMDAEGNGNIGVQSKSFGETGSRTFLNSRFDRYLEPVEKYRIYDL